MQFSTTFTNTSPKERSHQFQVAFGNGEQIQGPTQHNGAKLVRDIVLTCLVLTA